jgi:nucleoside-diphosphate-sugar epimerase
MRIVVIGATGNIGTSVVRALSADPTVDEIVGVARRRPALEIDKVRWVTADIVTSDLLPILRGSDAIVLLAWRIQPSRDESVTHAVNVEGSARVFDAAARAGVPAIIYSSSIGAYAVGPKDRAVDESFPATGIPTSFYSRHKAAVEQILDSFEAAQPQIRVARLRPGLVFKRESATEIRRLFAGPFLPNFLVQRDLIPVVPDHPRFRFQAVHADDLAQAFRAAVLDDDARGAYNVAAEPVLDGPELARLLGARTVPVNPTLLRTAADLTWRARLQPTPAGWVDMAFGVPIMDTTRVRSELGWSETRTSGEALLELMEGMRDGAGTETPPLDPASSGPGRVREIFTGVGRSGE